MIEWSRRARADIRDHKACIAKESPCYARRFTKRIITSVEKLEEFPKIGRHDPEAEGREDVRELIDQGYRPICPALPGKIFVVTVIHGSRDLEAEGIKPWDLV